MPANHPSHRVNAQRGSLRVAPRRTSGLNSARTSVSKVPTIAKENVYPINVGGEASSAAQATSTLKRTRRAAVFVPATGGNGESLRPGMISFDISNLSRSKMYMCSPNRLSEVSAQRSEYSQVKYDCEICAWYYFERCHRYVCGVVGILL